jgi:hypothetical protein
MYMYPEYQNVCCKIPIQNIIDFNHFKTLDEKIAV